jgi:hypothetical protein
MASSSAWTPEGMTTFTIGRFCDCVMFQTWSFW